MTWTLHDERRPVTSVGWDTGGTHFIMGTILTLVEPGTYGDALRTVA